MLHRILFALANALNDALVLPSRYIDNAEIAAQEYDIANARAEVWAEPMRELDGGRVTFSL